MDEKTLTAEILLHLNGATQPITAREIFDGIASHVPMPRLASALHDLRVGGQIAGERQEGNRALVYRALREGEAPNPAPRVAPPVKRIKQMAKVPGTGSTIPPTSRVSCLR